MTFSEIALRMYPYWLMGLFMVWATWKSKHKDLLKFNPSAFKKFLIFMAVVTIYRAVIFGLFGDHLRDMVAGAMTIPWQATLTVFWEDACHTVPLAILSRVLGEDKWWKKALRRAAIGMVMVSFGLGHVYQGVFAAALLSLYIPFTLKKGQEVGFGTIMACHTLYDLLTILTIKLMLG